MMSFETWNSSFPNRSLLTDEFDLNKALRSLDDDLFSIKKDDDDYPELIISQHDDDDYPELIISQPEDESFEDLDDSLLPTPIGGSCQVVSFEEVPLNHSLKSIDFSSLSAMVQALRDSAINEKLPVTPSLPILGQLSPSMVEADFGKNMLCTEFITCLTPVESRPCSPASSEDNSRSQQSSRWNQRFHELAEYRADRGHCNVPYLWSKNRPLSEWVKRQRHQYKLKTEGRHSALTDERQKMLTELGFVWNSRASLWEGRYQELLAYHQKFGHVRISKKTAEYRALSVWLKRQRHACRLFLAGDQSTCMNNERMSKLTDLGVKISLDKD